MFWWAFRSEGIPSYQTDSRRSLPKARLLRPFLSTLLQLKPGDSWRIDLSYCLWPEHVLFPLHPQQTSSNTSKTQSAISLLVAGHTDGLNWRLGFHHLVHFGYRHEGLHTFFPPNKSTCNLLPPAYLGSTSQRPNWALSHLLSSSSSWLRPGPG